jgi:sulfite exporter TauE/SafE
LWSAFWEIPLSDLNLADVSGMGFVAAALFGLLGSTHCAAMCGPLVYLYTKPLQGQPQWRIQRRHLIHSLGRLFTYTAIGALLGWTGSLLKVIPWSGALLATALGLCIIAMGVSYLGIGRASAAIDRALGRLGSRLASLWHGYSPAVRFVGAFTLGGMHAFLPCPLLYVVYSSAVALQDPLRAGPLLFAFGIGTVPMMWGLGTLVGRVPLAWKFKLKQLYGAVLAGWGGILFLHGLHAFSTP